MSSWTLSRSFSRSRPQVTPLPLEQPRNDDNLGPPPRYSNLAPLPEPQPSPCNPPEASPISVVHAQYVRSRFSAATLESRISSPSYTTFDNDVDAISISSSTITVTNPPHYSTLLGIAQPPTESPDSAGGAVPSLEYTFDICSGFKSEPWVTLTLYDAGPSAHGAPRQGRHPRFSSLEPMLGNVKLCLSSPHIIKNVELTLKGSVITGAVGDGGSIIFLEQEYVLWDRKFGDPVLLAHDHIQASPKYDGRMSGTWVFPFSIPFPTYVDLSTRHAIYPRRDEGPVRFLPERLDEGGTTAPFDIGGGLTGVETSAHSTPTQPPPTTPIGIKIPYYAPTEEGRLASHRAEMPTRSSMPRFSPMSALIPGAPSTPLLEPFIVYKPETDNTSADYATRDGRSPPLHQDSTTHGQPRSRGAASMQDPKLPTPTNSCSLPQSFLERDVMANVRYEMTLKITHGRFSSRSWVSTPVIHEPVTISRPMTLGREIAYRRREMPSGPHLDPGGWKQLPPVVIRGTFDDRRTLTVCYSLFLAMPLSYARGTVLPCCLVIACDDTIALNLFANPRTPRVRLRRSTRFLRNQAEFTQMGEGHFWDSSVCQGGGSRAPAVPRPATRAWGQGITPFLLTALHEEGGDDDDGDDDDEMLRSSDKGDEQEVGDKAGWCAPAHFTQEPHVRRLYGEIRLPQRLQPTCRFPLFNILYRVDLLAPTTNAFVPDTPNHPSSRKGKGKVADTGEDEGAEHVYTSHFVEITTDGRKGEPAPIAFVGVAD